MEERNVPILRFPEFSEENTSEMLGKITTCVDYRGRGPTKSDEGIQLITARNIRKGYIDHTSKEYVPVENYSSVMSKGLPEVGDILFTTEAPLGNVAEVEDAKIALAQRVIKFRAKNVLLNKYLLHYMLSPVFQKKIKKRAIGTTVQGISNKEVNRVRVAYPSKQEQQKIASFLSAVDKKIEQLTRKKELLEEYKKGVMQKLFPKPGEQHPELRFKQEDGSVFPDWEVKRLGDLTFKVGKKNKENIPYPIYSINNQEGFLPQSDQFEGLDSVDRGYDISMYKIIHPETFAYNPARINVGSIGYSYDLDEVIISSLYVCFKTKPDLTDEYLMSYIDTYQFNNFVLRYQEGGVRQYLFYENFSSIKIPLPSVAEQKKIASFINRLDYRVREMNDLIDKAQTFKKGLLQQMFV